jgi:hypothetical protein
MIGRLEAVHALSGQSPGGRHNGQAEPLAEKKMDTQHIEV